MRPLRPYQQQAVKETWQALKKNDEPVLLMASVGAGKSLMISRILLTMQESGKRALCIVNNAELVRNNCATFIDEGGHASIYCAALGSKDASASVVFGTPQSILNGINKHESIADTVFNIIVVDEAHAINYLNLRSTFMQLLRFYKQNYKSMRILGATGTDFRFKGTSIVGEDCLFKTKVGNITTEQLINDGYLIKPTFDVDKELWIDFSRVAIRKNGQFDKKQLELVVSQNARLTELICKQVVHIMESKNRFGVFFFATTKKHAQEILSHLPTHESAIILGDTPQHERTVILDKARQGKIRYLVNISIISVGVDIPAFDTVAYLRPTESLVLLVQTIGRALRLSLGTAKQDALILDFAGNIQRHADWDNPILLDALKQTVDKDKPLLIKCPACMQMNTTDARRCIGITNNKRCDYYFEFKECPDCTHKNDITARFCHNCKIELIDPNNKLSLITKPHEYYVTVTESNYQLSGTYKSLRLLCSYTFIDDVTQQVGRVSEWFSPYYTKSINIFYGNFVKLHCDKPSQWYPHLYNSKKMEEMLQSIRSPTKLILIIKDRTSIGVVFKIKKKLFEEVNE